LIDAHHHLWKYNRSDYGWMDNDALSPLRRDYLIEDLTQAAAPAGVTGTVAVQACQNLAETEWLLQTAAQHSLIQGVVGWVPLYSPDLASVLDRFASNPSFKAVRHVVQDEPDDRFILGPGFNRGVEQLQRHSLVYDILIFERHLPHAIEFVDRHPQQVFVLDHIAKPRIKENLLEPWAGHIRELARRENVYCKLSGMATEADWTHWTAQQLRPYFDVVLAAFGPRRLMFGSDWPVLNLAAEYSTWLDTVRTWIADLSPDEQRRILSGTAREAYRL
jgi:L-fuconolactonase